MLLFGKKLIPLLFASPPSPSLTTTTTTTSSLAISTFQPNVIHSTKTKVAFLRKAVVPQAQQESHDVMVEAAKEMIEEIDEDVVASVSPPRKIINDVQSIYKELAKGSYSTRDHYHPMIQFKYMSPNNIRESTNFPMYDTDLNANSHSDVVDDSKDNANELKQAFERIKNDGNDDKTESKTIAIYLPGLDGVGISATTQFDDLSHNYELWRMYINDRDTTTSFAELINTICEFIQDVVQLNEDGDNRKIILIGESFGGLLAPSVALRLQSILKNMSKRGSDVDVKDVLQGMVLVNPATSFDQTQWSTIVPLLASLRHIEKDQEKEQEQQTQNPLFELPELPTPYSVIGGFALAATVPDSKQFQTIFDIFSSTKVTNTQELSDVLASMTDGFGILADKLPAEVMEHRVSQWLNVGCMVLNGNGDNDHSGSRLKELIGVETLIIAGADDNMLPTKKEADRLVNLLPNCTSMVVKGSGHFVLDDRFNLTQAIMTSPLSKTKAEVNKSGEKKPYDPILDWKLPSGRIVEKTIEARVKPLRTLTSPVFFSSDVDGTRKKGLGFVPPNSVNGIPNKKPMLFVANHQLLGLDLGMIISQLIEERGINARGLAHPVIFQGGDGFGEPISDDEDDNNKRIERRDRNGRILDDDHIPGGTFQTFGAVMVTPRNYYRLMESGQTGLLFPGGVREVFHGKDESYELFWPEKVDFVRVAARFNATIVPISAAGAADSANILIDAPDILNLPFGLGERAANSSKNAISARFDMSNSEELFQPPLVVPKPLPSRHYFVFGKPFETTSISHKSPDMCKKLYDDVKMELRRGLDDILIARENDPFNNTATRLAYETLYGKQAPTFSIEELNPKN